MSEKKDHAIYITRQILHGFDCRHLSPANISNASTILSKLSIKDLDELESIFEMLIKERNRNVEN